MAYVDLSRDEAALARIFLTLGLAAADEPVRATALAGGVSSGIYRIDLRSGSYCLKQALPRLKVAKEWNVPVERVFGEIDWLRTAGAIVPGHVPKVLGQDDATKSFVMEFLGPEFRNWKSDLLAGHVDDSLARTLGDVVGRIHAATADDAALAARFATDANFHAIRLEPYLVETARVHPALADGLLATVARTASTRRVLVHGDVSPKNIMVGPHGPVLLDAECAWFGDPAFDLAFCLNHFLLKSAHLPSRVDALMGCYAALKAAYFAQVTWEPRDLLEARAASLLPGLTLARVDGKSPVEYLGEPQRDLVRTLATKLLRDTPVRLLGMGAGFMKIEQVLARRIWDSRGRPTVEVEVINEDGTRGIGIAPAGASMGTREAVELRDGGPRFKGLGVQRALDGISREIAPALAGRDVTRQAGIDAALVALDGTPNKSRLGGNALVATSLAVLHAAAAHARLPLWQYLAQGRAVQLPLPQIQIFGGGAHAGRRVDVQDFMVIAVGAASFSQALEMTAEVYRAAGELMAARGKLAGVADEGGWWPSFSRNEEALDALVEAIERSGFVPGSDVAIALDIAASEFGRGGRYRLALENEELDADALCERLVRWTQKYPIVSIEDPLAEDDEAGLAAFTRAVGDRVQVVGDDYLVTNADRVRAAAAAGACNCALIKPNQAGTVTETLAALDAAKAAGFATIVSARSGETEDVAIVHLATGWNAGQLKVGSFARSERMAKWNEGVRIETRVGAPSGFAGRSALA